MNYKNINTMLKKQLITTKNIKLKTFILGYRIITVKGNMYFQFMAYLHYISSQ